LAVGLAVVLGLIISAGYSAGFDHRVAPNEAGRFVFALGSALTKKVYGLEGYVVLEPIEAALQSGGLTSDPDKLARIGARFPENFYDSILINNAIKEASSVPIRIPRPKLQNEKYNVRTSSGDDLGFVDFVLLSFYLFSPSIEAFFPTFLVIFFASVFLYWCAFRDQPVYVAVLLLQCIMLYVLFVSPLFPGIPGRGCCNVFGGSAWTTPATPHFLSTLAVVPLLHVLAAISRLPRTTPVQIACLIGQALILYFVICIRLSAVWVMAPLVLGALLAVVRPPKTIRDYSEPHPADQQVDTKPNVFGAGASTPAPFFSSLQARVLGWALQCWPVLLVFIVLVGAHLKFEMHLHPLYRDGMRLPQHGIWREIYYGLQQHPQWIAKYGDTHRINGKIATGDEQPIAAVLRHLDAHPEIDRRKILDPAGSLFWGAIEKYSRLALIRFVREDPWFFLENLGYKLLELLHALKWLLFLVMGSLSMSGLGLVIAGILGAAVATGALAGHEKPSYRRFLTLLCICVPISWLPNLATIVGWELMADAIVFMLLVLFVGSSYVIGMSAAPFVRAVFVCGASKLASILPRLFAGAPSAQSQTLMMPTPLPAGGGGVAPDPVEVFQRGSCASWRQSRASKAAPR
jgi:hypothetical protein